MTRSIVIRVLAVLAALAVSHAASAGEANAAARQLAERHEKLRTLASRGHATATEVADAAVAARTAAAVAEADDTWRSALKQIDASPRDHFSQAQTVSDLLILPTAARSVADEADFTPAHAKSPDDLPTDLKSRLATVLRLEASAIPVEAAIISVRRQTSLVDAVRTLHGRRHASTLERQAVEATLDRVAAELAELKRRRDDLLATADQLSPAGGTVDSHATPLSAADIPALLGGRSWPPDAAMRTLSNWLASTVTAAHADASVTAALDHLTRVRKTSESARRPTELADAEQRHELAAARATAAARRVTAASAAFRVALDAPPEVARVDWRQWAGADLATRTPVSLPPLPAVEEPSGLIDSRRTAFRPYASTWGGSQPTYRGQGYDVWRPEPVEMRPLRADPIGVRLGVAPPLAPPRAFEPGWSYSSGYMFGQKRYDLPARLRYPRADGYGGPWYLPGSPTNRLRYQFPR